MTTIEPGKSVNPMNRLFPRLGVAAPQVTRDPSPPPTPIPYFEERRRFKRRRHFEAEAKQPLVSLIIPALDEADGLRQILPRIPSRVDEIIVVDGGSTDGTMEVVEAVCPECRLVGQAGRGKGNAIKAGLSVAQGEILITMDADGSMLPEDILSFVDKLEEGYDFVKGSRSLADGGSADFTRLRRTGNTALTQVANVVFGSKYTDITFGYNGYWRSTIAHLGILADGFEFEIQAALRAASVGMRTAEVPTFEPARVGGVSKLNPFSDGLAILRIILSEASPRRAGKVGTAAQMVSPLLATGAGGQPVGGGESAPTNVALS